MLMARAFWITRRSAGLFSGLGPPALTAIVISLPMRANALDILSQRANIVAFRVSKIRPIVAPVEGLRSARHARPESSRAALARQGRFSLPVAGRRRGDQRIDELPRHRRDVL